MLGGLRISTVTTTSGVRLLGSDPQLFTWVDSQNFKPSTRYLRLDVRRSADLHCHDYILCEITWERPTTIYVGGLSKFYNLQL